MNGSDNPYIEWWPEGIPKDKLEESLQSMADFAEGEPSLSKNCICRCASCSKLFWATRSGKYCDSCVADKKRTYDISVDKAKELRYKQQEIVEELGKLANYHNEKNCCDYFQCKRDCFLPGNVCPKHPVNDMGKHYVSYAVYTPVVLAMRYPELRPVLKSKPGLLAALVRFTHYTDHKDIKIVKCVSYKNRLNKKGDE